MIARIEHLITLLINDFLSRGNETEISLNNNNSNNCNNNTTTINSNIIIDIFGNEQETSSFYKLRYSRIYSRQRFASFLFVLAEVHELFLLQSHCTYRQLYYRSTNIECTSLHIRNAVGDVCQALNTSSWKLGIFAAGKCFLSGPLIVHMSNGDLINCNEFKGATLMPPNFTYIDTFETTAKFVLVIEKNTVFQFLIANDIFSHLNGNIILITARGYPDICTRWILHKLWIENRLNIYALVDGDPFGIEIMLIYRYGSISQSLNASSLTCPNLKWLGIHATDVACMDAQIEPLTAIDNKKIISLLNRRFLEDEIKKELLLLQRLQYKVKIDNISSTIIDYIINKIKRQLVL